MSRQKGTSKRKQKEAGVPFNAVILGASGFVFAYLFAEAGLDPNAHLAHWGAAGGGGILGVGVGYLWHRARASRVQ